jgi:hypothetical protein
MRPYLLKAALASDVGGTVGAELHTAYFQRDKKSPVDGGRVLLVWQAWFCLHVGRSAKSLTSLLVYATLSIRRMRNNERSLWFAYVCVLFFAYIYFQGRRDNG